MLSAHVVFFSNFEIKHSKVEGAYCLGVFQNGKDPTTLLGGKALNFTRTSRNSHSNLSAFLICVICTAWFTVHFAVGPLGQITVHTVNRLFDCF